MNAFVYKNRMACNACGTVRPNKGSQQPARKRLVCESCGDLTDHEPTEEFIPFDDGGIPRDAIAARRRFEIERRIRFVAHQCKRVPDRKEVVEITDVSRRDFLNNYQSYQHAAFQALKDINDTSSGKHNVSLDCPNCESGDTVRTAYKTFKQTIHEEYECVDCETEFRATYSDPILTQP